MILLQEKKIQKGKKHGVTIYMLEGNKSLVQLPMTCTTSFLRGASFITSGGILLPVEGVKELCSAMESLHTITL